MITKLGSGLQRIDYMWLVVRGDEHARVHPELAESTAYVRTVMKNT